MGSTENGSAWACRQVADDGGFNVDFALHAFSPFEKPWSVPYLWLD